MEPRPRADHLRRSASSRRAAGQASPRRLLAAALLAALLVAACGPDPMANMPSGTPAGEQPPVTITPGQGFATAPVGTSPSSMPPVAPAATATAPLRGPWPQFGFAGHPMWDSVAQATQALDMLAADHFGVLRLDASWRNMEPSRDTYAYLDKLDAVIDGALSRGIAPVVAIVEAPGWANGGGDLFTPPRDPADYAAFAGMLADRYRGRVAGWEIWNEPDLADYWHPAPSASAYARLLVAAAGAIRAADPDAIVVAAGATFGNFGFLQGLYDSGARGSFQALAIHPYTLTRAPDDLADRQHSLVAILDDAHGLLVAQGDAAVPIWVTELGWATSGVNSVTAGQQAEYMARSVGIVRDRPWVQVLAMYTIDVRHSERHGLSRDGARSPSWVAYAQAVRGGP